MCLPCLYGTCSTEQPTGIFPRWWIHSRGDFAALLWFFEFQDEAISSTVLPLWRDLYLRLFNLADYIRLCVLEWFSSAASYLDWSITICTQNLSTPTPYEVISRWIEAVDFYRIWKKRSCFVFRAAADFSDEDASMYVPVLDQSSKRDKIWFSEAFIFRVWLFPSVDQLKKYEICLIFVVKLASTSSQSFPFLGGSFQTWKGVSLF